MGPYRRHRFWAVVQIALFTLGPTTGVGIILVTCVLAGIGVSAAHVLPWAIIPGVIECGEWQTGGRHEGMIYSLVTLMRKATTSLALPAVGLILQFTGYVPNAAQQLPTALLGIRTVIGVILAVLLCLGILFAALYPLSREEYVHVAQELDRRRSAQSR
ncbi:MAG: MFS transporter [Anaerolineae bacterium]|jgi:GPH family glycoside/pentoside/hexuronide:cation symporter